MLPAVAVVSCQFIYSFLTFDDVFPRFVEVYLSVFSASPASLDTSRVLVGLLDSRKDFTTTICFFLIILVGNMINIQTSWIPIPPP